MNRLKIKELREINDLLISMKSSGDFSKPLMKIYCVTTCYSKCFFDTEEELNEYIKKFNKNSVYIISTIEYYKYLAGRSDVFVTKSNNNTTLRVALDELTYAVYNPEKSMIEREFCWEHIEGSLKEEYKAFRDRGIKFENDIYAIIEEDIELLKKCWESYKIKRNFKLYVNDENKN